jgi:hypothetical protein
MKQRIAALISANRKFVPLFTTAILFIIAYAAGVVFFQGMRSPQVFFNLFRSSPFLLIAAIGGTFVILTGRIGLSVGGVIALTTVASAALLREGWDPWVVMPLMLAMGVILGSIMGSLVTYMKVQPFIATLAFLWIGRGLCFFISDDAIAINNPTYKILSGTRILIPLLSDPVTKTGPFISLLSFSFFISEPPPTACHAKPLREDEAARLMKTGAAIVYERNGGPSCIDELYAIYPDGKNKGDDGKLNVEKQATPSEVNAVLEGIDKLGWFTEELYSTWHLPCG